MKGMSDIIGAVMLMGIAVSIASLYASWAPEFAEDMGIQLADESNQDLKCDNAEITLQNVVHYKDNDRTDLEVYNAGTIRFTDSIRVATINSSSIMNETSLEGLDVGESVSREIDSNKIPDQVLVSSNQCPDAGGTTTIIQVE